MKDSGMSDSQFMEAQKSFQKHHSSYNNFVKNIKQEEKPENFWEKVLTFFKKMLKYK